MPEAVPPPARLLRSELLEEEGFSINKLSLLVPLDCSYINSSKTINLCIRVVYGEAKKQNAAPEVLSKQCSLAAKPFLVYLVGGPGSDNPATKLAYLNRFILERGYQILYLDYRGTGGSSPVTAESLQGLGGAELQADYLKFFRQDNIVRDLEAVRRLVAAEIEGLGGGGGKNGEVKWSLMGQSYGGWVALTYLSLYPGSLREVFITGGLAPIGHTAEEVYAATYKRVVEANIQFYGAHPEDVDHVHRLVEHILCENQDCIALPGGGTLTAQRLLGMGRELGCTGGMDRVHAMITTMVAELGGPRGGFSPATLAELEGLIKFDSRPLYAVLHEAIYCDGTASRWAAERVGCAMDEFSWLRPGALSTALRDRSQPLYMSGEHVYRFHFDLYPGLRGLKTAADILANYSGWGPLYDEKQLCNNDVPVYAVVYEKDMFVDAALSRETASKLRNIKVCESKELCHTALRDRTAEALRLLWQMRGDGPVV